MRPVYAYTACPTRTVAPPRIDLSLLPLMACHFRRSPSTSMVSRTVPMSSAAAHWLGGRTSRRARASQSARRGISSLTNVSRGASPAARGVSRCRLSQCFLTAPPAAAVFLSLIRKASDRSAQVLSAVEIADATYNLTCSMLRRSRGVGRRASQRRSRRVRCSCDFVSCHASPPRTQPYPCVSCTRFLPTFFAALHTIGYQSAQAYPACPFDAETSPYNGFYMGKPWQKKVSSRVGPRPSANFSRNGW